jgi:hypothetical protein
MMLSARRLMFWRRPAGTLRAAVAALILAYIALAGETIHCQYFPTSHNEHDEHSTEPKRTTDHTTHCLVASHATSTAVTANAGALIQIPTPTARLVAIENFTSVSALFRLTPSRAPPVL